MDTDLKRYLESAIISSVKGCIIERWLPPEHLRGGLIMPAIVREREARSAFWGRLCKVSSAPTKDEELATLREFYNSLIGHFVLFNPTNPVLGGMTNYPLVQMLAIGDILMALKPKEFFEVIVSQMVGKDEAVELFKKFNEQEG